MLRVFVAVELEESVRKRAALLIEKLSVPELRVNWVREENLHLTLKFLGDLSAEQVPEICRAIEAAVGGMTGTTIDFRGLGAFPDWNRPRTLWVGVDEGQEFLQQIHAELEEVFHDFGFRRERRRFSAHLTLARVRQGGPQVALLQQKMQQFRDYQLGRSFVSELVVFSSELTPEGPIYTPLGRCDLAG